MTDTQNKDQHDLAGAEAASKIHDIAKAAGRCMLSTDVTQFPGDTRPMEIQAVDDDGTLWFISSSDSEKNRDIARDVRVLVSIQHDSVHLAFSGQGQIHTDAPTIQKHWTAFAKLWFDGKDDPRVTVLSVTPETGRYWEAGAGTAGLLTRMALSGLTGKPQGDGGVSGTLTL